MTDANQGYSLDVALQAAAGFADAGAFWLEEPLFVEDVEGHAALRERGKVPIAVGENLHTCGAFRDFVVSGAVDFLQPDVARAGGISEIRKITAMAAKHKVPVSFHTWGDGVALAASVHLAAALQDCIVMELDYTYNPLREELLREPIQSSQRVSHAAGEARPWDRVKRRSVAKICLCRKRGACGQAENPRFGLVRATSLKGARR